MADSERESPVKLSPAEALELKNCKKDKEN
jgi:hypothetical protein